MYSKTLIFLYTFCCNVLLSLSLPQETIRVNSDVENFQNAVQKQTFNSVLFSIEERLRNLDNIYSMQLSETLKTKLEQYHRKLEILDKKMIQLESMIMLNLDKISENISTKNYRDDIVKTQIYRKLDNMYDGLSHRMSYMDKKHDMALDKLQIKTDTVMSRLEKMEDSMNQKYSDIENEFSDTQIIIEEMKTSLISTEENYQNVTSGILHNTIQNGLVINSINETISILSQEVHDVISPKVEKIENKTEKNLDISLNSQTLLYAMKSELKEDYNNYASKVADMNIEAWKKNDIIDIKIETIEKGINQIKTEVQNGVRSLMLQIGKIGGKEPLNNEKSMESLRKSLNLSMEKILSNQGLFLESCHRVQMDESQIESEISVMLEKLIDMLEKKMTTVMKDIKTLEKSVKNHDSRINRNILQANTNVVSLYEKNTKNNELVEHELNEIKFYINSLFTFVQDVLPKSKDAENNNTNISEHLFNITQNLYNLNSNAISNWNELKTNFTIFKKSLENMKNILIDSKNQSISILNQSDDVKNNCTENYGNLIDIRAGSPLCQDNKNEKTSTEIPDDLKNVVLEIFGSPKSLNSTNKPDKSKSNKSKKKCKPNLIGLIDIRADSSSDSDVLCNNTGKTKRTKKKNTKLSVKSRFNDEESVDDYVLEDDALETSTEITTESTTNADFNTETTPLTN